MYNQAESHMFVLSPSAPRFAPTRYQLSEAEADPAHPAVRGRRDDHLPLGDASPLPLYLESHDLERDKDLVRGFAPVIDRDPRFGPFHGDDTARIRHRRTS